MRWFGLRCLGAETIGSWMPFLGSSMMFLVKKVGLPTTPDHALVLGLVPAWSLSSDDSQSKNGPPVPLSGAPGMRGQMKAVIPAAGLGTRVLQYTVPQRKGMLPILDKPANQYVVEDALQSGIQDILIITGRTKRAIEDHFDMSPELERHLRERARRMRSTSSAEALRGRASRTSA